MTDQQTAPAARALVRMPEQATARRDITILGWGDILRPQDDILARRSVGKGLKLYDELARDGHVSGVLDKRKRAVVSRDWKVEPGGTRRADKQAAKLVERVLAGEWGLAFDGLCLDLLDAQLKGYATSELIWELRDGFIVPVAAKARDPRRFVFNRGWELRLLTPENQLDGEALPARKFLVHRFGTSFDPYGLGLGHRLFWPCFFKRNAVQFWALFCEKFGMPTAKGTYGPGVDPDKLLRDLAGLAQDSAVVVPEGTVVEFLEAARAGGVDTYEKFLRWLDEQISEAVLGETLSTNIGQSGSRAASETHNEVRQDLCDGDCDELSATLNGQLLTWITEANYLGAAPPTVWRPRPENRKEAAETSKAETDAKISAVDYVDRMRAAGYEPEDPEAEFVDQVNGRWFFVGKPEPAALPPEQQPRAAAFAAPTVRDAGDDLTDQIEAAGGPVLDAMIDAVKAELDQAIRLRETPVQFSARLARLESTMPIDGLAELLRDGLALAAVTGMSDQADGR
ncbi:DUF935 family protein [Mycobacterium sp. KBS0706]|uniref:DUF935 domain-containing protein n=1 Tax=Mycobacterium sp. KBS0706 TaxID=2578109 RepID=UPI00110FC7E1|nr:DUF935 family protein [Mycobacterium sp. KBS0706]TSD86012.1 DUF935 family protein [Mycobacterium sp. KBS0706]